MEGIKKIESMKVALLTLIGLVLILSIGICIFNIEVRVLLIFGLIFVSCVLIKLGNKFSLIMENMKGGFIRAFPALLIFILIGALIGTWIQSGIVPSLIYYGLNLINAKYFLPVGLIICSITSLATGTSWGTCGTVGVALMAMGMSLNIPAPLVAGMIVSGAFFGDKMSPLSDTTNLAAVSADTTLYKHVKSMTYTTAPSFLIALLIYTGIGFKYFGDESGNFQMVSLISGSIKDIFNVNIFLLIPIIIVLILSIKKVDAIIALTIGTILGLIFSIIFQGTAINEAFNAIAIGYKSSTNIKFVDELLSRGGIESMMSTFSLSFIALSLGSLLETFGFLDIIICKVLKRVKRLGSLAMLVIGTSFLTNVIMGEIYLAIILNGSLYKKEFKKRNLDRSMLSRFLEEGGTLLGPLIPWTTAGAFVSGVLGISSFSYFKYSFLNLINPVVSIIFCYLGIAVLKDKKASKENQVQEEDVINDIT